MLALVIVYLAAACQLRAKPAGVLAPLPKPAPPRPSFLPYLAIVGSYLLLAVIGLRSVRFDSLGGGLLVGAVALTFLVSARQYIALHDYGRLAVRYQELASVDGITGLYNRRHFMEAAEAAVARAQRLGQPLVALMIDVDNFKQINDTHGHIAGDQVLAEMAQACREHVRPDDIVGRYGGDEFIIIIAGITSLRATQIAEQLARPAARVLGRDGKPLTYTASIGIAECLPGCDLPTLLMHADHGHVPGQAGRRRQLAHLHRHHGSHAGGHHPGRRHPGPVSRARRPRRSGIMVPVIITDGRVVPSPRSRPGDAGRTGRYRGRPVSQPNLPAPSAEDKERLVVDSTARPAARWGILGTGGIARQFTQDLLLAGHTVTAIGSRTRENAERFAVLFELPAAHASYEALVADPSVDLIYVATPHPFHYPNAMLALEAGKHVLVEKPFTLNAAQAQHLVTHAADNGLLILEAMWTRWLPHMARLREIVAAGTIGELRSMSADHSSATARRSRAPAQRPGARRRGAARPRRLSGLLCI